eukprot:INCI19219.2.p1 GENE.INCI19219.2~~INCI19219.2.p1  ORF type:complete len:693 (+),score=109.86 INCI19219.2:212-2290(+)
MFPFAGTPLKWPDSLEFLEYIRKHGIEQFLNIMKQVADRSNDSLLYGDEVEFHLVAFDPITKTVRLPLNAYDVLATLEKQNKDYKEPTQKYNDCAWHPEFGSWMIETTPSAPYGSRVSDLLQIEENMRLRRARLYNGLGPNVTALSTVAFPLLGVGDFTLPPHKPNGEFADSDTIPDECINPHPRFGALVRNIRMRRGSKVSIKAKVFEDTLTSEKAIEMDCMAYGMGMCCLQVTFQACDISESRHLYDQLAVLGPVMMALTAGTPILHGHLVHTDCRWKYIAASVDDRTPEERGQKPSAPSAGASATATSPSSAGQGGGGAAKADAAAPASSREDEYKHMVGGGVKRLSKSRYATISAYICNHKGGRDPHSSTTQYNDIPCEVDDATKATLEAGGVDPILATHLAHLWTRDPLVIFKERIEIDDQTLSDHFENIQSTNWQSVRWKPPPPTPSNPNNIGWRTEFRTMEVQFTDFENAAFSVFIVLASRVILAYELNLYIPLSQLDENMKRAHEPAAAVKQKFFFRRHLANPCKEECSADGPCPVHDNKNAVAEMSAAEILMGKGTTYPGLVPLIHAYLDQVGVDTVTRKRVNLYLDLIVQRATGELLTPACWIRKFVHNHPAYRKDSKVPQEVAYDLLRRIDGISRGDIHEPLLFGDIEFDPISKRDAFPASFDARRKSATSYVATHSARAL